MALLNNEQISSIITGDTVLFWFRRDLRLDDNAGLYHAAKAGQAVLPIFIFDTNILSQLDTTYDRRVEYILESLRILQGKLVSLGSSLLILHGNPVDIFRSINPRAVYANHDYEPYAMRRDQEVLRLLSRKQIPFNTFKDQVIFEKNEVVKPDKSLYTVFTAYARQWEKQLGETSVMAYPTKKYHKSFLKLSPQPFPELREIGFSETGSTFPPRIIPRSLISQYDKTRDFPGVKGTSRIGVHLRFGTVSVRSLVAIALRSNPTWLNQLIWREFFTMILYHFPENEEKPFKKAYDNIPWSNDEDDFKRWCEGMTGYPLVDAGMRELNATGFIHNRVRMVAASFLSKHLLIDWRWGQAYFAKRLLDYDLANNNGGWQWAAGCGCDAAPYFRIFNPIRQAIRFDADKTYIRKWIPELGTPTYPLPMVNHDEARITAIRIYKNTLEHTGEKHKRTPRVISL